MKKTLKFGRLKLVLDKYQVFPDDPGNGTPALIYIGENVGTYWCVQNEGEIYHDKHNYFIKLTEEEINWLWSVEDEVDKFLYR